MNTKKLFMLLAAVLLGSVSAFAQSGNNSPLVGDVNGDSKVDVADITAVIKIIKNTQEHYFYLGTIEPTAENYKIIPGVVTTYTSIVDAEGATASVDAGQTLYMLCPAEWMAGKTVAVEDNSGKTFNFSEEIDAITISGYVIYKTQVWNEFTTITLKTPTTYYWYVGQSNPKEMTSISPIVNDNTSEGWRLIGTSVPTYTMSNPLWNGQVNEIVFDNYNDVTAYIALPNTTIKLRDGLGNDATSQMVSKGTKTIDGVTYTIYQNSSNVMSYSLNGLVY